MPSSMRVNKWLYNTALVISSMMSLLSLGEMKWAMVSLSPTSREAALLRNTFLVFAKVRLPPSFCIMVVLFLPGPPILLVQYHWWGYPNRNMTVSGTRRIGFGLALTLLKICLLFLRLLSNGLAFLTSSLSLEFLLHNRSKNWKLIPSPCSVFRSAMAKELSNVCGSDIIEKEWFEFLYLLRRRKRQHGGLSDQLIIPILLLDYLSVIWIDLAASGY